MEETEDTPRLRKREQMVKRMVTIVANMNLIYIHTTLVKERIELVRGLSMGVVDMSVIVHNVRHIELLMRATVWGEEVLHTFRG